MTVEEGDTFDLMCDAIGVPKPMIEWSRQGRKPLPVGKEKAMVIIHIPPYNLNSLQCKIGYIYKLETHVFISCIKAGVYL
jgi:hypothetical protein